MLICLMKEKVFYFDQGEDSYVSLYTVVILFNMNYKAEALHRETKGLLL